MEEKTFEGNDGKIYNEAEATIVPDTVQPSVDWAELELNFGFTYYSEELKAVKKEPVKPPRYTEITEAADGKPATCTKVYKLCSNYASKPTCMLDCQPDSSPGTVTVINADATGNHEYCLFKITKPTEEECDLELNYQLNSKDGIFWVKVHNKRTNQDYYRETHRIYSCEQMDIDEFYELLNKGQRKEYAVINGKTYTPKTSILAATWNNALSPFDPEYTEETLYQRKKSREYFLHKAGNHKSEYASCINDIITIGGEVFLPLTFQEAEAWALERLSRREYEALFGEVKEKRGRKKYVLSLPVTLMENYQRKADREGISLAEIIEKKLQS